MKSNKKFCVNTFGSLISLLLNERLQLLVIYITTLHYTNLDHVFQPRKLFFISRSADMTLAGSAPLVAPTAF